MKWNVRLFLRDFRKKTKSTNKERIAIIVRRRNKKTSRKSRHDIKKSRREHDIRKFSKKDDIRWFWNRKSQRSENRIFFLLLTERRKDTDIEALRRLAIIVTILTKLYFSTDDIAKIIDELNKAKRRILLQISETLTKLFKYREILFFMRDFHFYDRKNNDSNDLDFFFWRFKENFWQRRRKNRYFVFDEDFKTSRKTFSLFFTHDEKKN